MSILFHMNDRLICLRWKPLLARQSGQVGYPHFCVEVKQLYAMPVLKNDSANICAGTFAPTLACILRSAMAIARAIRPVKLSMAGPFLLPPLRHQNETPRICRWEVE